MGWLRNMAVLVLVSTLAACSPSRSLFMPEEDREALEDYRNELTEFADTTNDYIAQTQRGVDLSELTLGWFTYDVLMVLASQDLALHQRFNRDGHDLEDYMKTEFHDQPKAEIDAVGILAKQERTAPRLAAKFALETLQTIPDPSEPAETQANDRKTLADALIGLQSNLRAAARDVVLPPQK